MEHSNWKNRLNLCCDEEMYGKIKGLAKSERLSISSLVRTLLAEALRRKELSDEQI